MTETRNASPDTLSGGWQSTADNPPPSGFYLAHEDGAIRTMMLQDGKWEMPDFPVLVLETGDRLVPREVAARGRGETLAMCQTIYSPTHWMTLPDAPESNDD